MASRMFGSQILMTMAFVSFSIFMQIEFENPSRTIFAKIMDMQVFTENWLEALACRYRDYKRHTRPFVYFVATEDEFKLTRDQIEEWVALLPANLRKKAIARLQSEAGFKQTYHELAVGDILRGFGFQTDYEMDFNGQTPDWCVSASDGSKFIVEVFTENTSQVVEAWARCIISLPRRFCPARPTALARTPA